jgi:hypothetical protein
MPPVGIPVEKLNQQLHVSAPAGWNTFKVNSDIALQVEVIGSETVVFPPDFGTGPFLYEDGNSVEAQQVPTVYHHGDVVVPSSGGDPLLAGVVDTFPVLQQADGGAHLRLWSCT